MYSLGLRFSFISTLGDAKLIYLLHIIPVLNSVELNLNLVTKKETFNSS